MEENKYTYKEAKTSFGLIDKRQHELVTHNEFNKYINEFNTQGNHQDDALVELYGVANNHDTRLEAAEQTIEEHSTTLANHEQRVTQAEETLVEHGRRITTTEEKNDSQDEIIQRMNERLKVVEDDNADFKVVTVFANNIQKVESFVAKASQRTFTLTLASYIPGQNRLQVFVDGVQQTVNDGFTELDSRTFQFTEGLNAGMKVTAHYFTEEASDDLTQIMDTIKDGPAILDGLIAKGEQLKADSILVQDTEPLPSDNCDIWFDTSEDDDTTLDKWDITSVEGHILAREIEQTNAQLSDFRTKTTGFINIKSYEEYVVNNDWYNAITQALYDLDNKGKLYFPNGEYLISEPIKIYGASHYTKTGITLEGESKAGVVIKCMDAMECVLDIAPDNIHYYNINLSNIYFNGEDKAEDGIRCVGMLAKSTWQDLMVRGKECGIRFNSDIWQNKFTNLMIYGGNYGVFMNAHGTSNSFTACFVYGTKIIGWQLSGTYTFIDNVACDDNLGTAYLFRFCDITIGSLGNETSHGDKTIDVVNGRVSLMNATIFSTKLKDGYVGIKCHDGYISVDQLVFNAPNDFTCENGKMYEFGTLADIKINYISNNHVTFTGLQTGEGVNKLKIDGLNARVDGVQVRPYLGNVNRLEKTTPNMPFTLPNVAITWCDDHPNTVDGNDVQWQQPFPKGTLYICKKPKNNIVCYLRTDDSATATRDCTWLKIVGTL